ncbi:hypothetical protein SUGI_0129340 [Cryptomeria japonica]|nr:hypothetical protein SUGI_0129340 [Cryptomeria japonica]
MEETSTPRCSHRNATCLTVKGNHKEMVEFNSGDIGGQERRCYLEEEKKRGQVELSTERKGFDFDRSGDSLRQYLRAATSLLSKQKI